LPALIRDFSKTHPDFESFGGDTAFTGLVKAELGGDGKPVYAHPGATAETTGPAEFAQWYNDTLGVNEKFPIVLTLSETSPGVFVYDNRDFFPVDGRGFGDEGNPHNFHFTTEIHTSFYYKGGEVFTFTGDDDVWVFINRKLAIDLGGLHPVLSQQVNLDTSASLLGISAGNRYDMDIFHAERHTTASNFHIETTIDCFVIE
jgi:fibro-slime domain-containing protein